MLRELGGVADIPSLQHFCRDLRVKLESAREIFERREICRACVKALDTGASAGAFMTKRSKSSKAT